MTHRLHRRQFLQHAGLAGAALIVSSAHVSSAAQAQSDKLIVGVMGAGRGASLAADFASLNDCQVRYMCDVDLSRAQTAAAAVERRQKLKPTVVTDFRRVLDDPAVHALAIAAPDHWHAPATILACAAGKHVYVEKPCSHNPREGELAIIAARKHNRVVQQGTQRRSWALVAEAIQKVRDGIVGKTLFSRTWYNATRGSIGRGRPAPVPPNLDWSLWQGPAPQREYRNNVVHYNWHWFWHWGTGELGNNGVHGLDLCRWGLDVDYPRRITAGGGRYHFEDDQETPDTHMVMFDFGDKAIAYEGQSCHPQGYGGSGFGVAFHGNKGTLIIEGGNGYRILDSKDREIAKAGSSASDTPHLRNFLDCIRSRQRPIADIEEAHKSTLLCHLGNIAWRVGRTLNLDPQTHRILNDPEADALWSREYQKGWEPKA